MGKGKAGDFQKGDMVRLNAGGPDMSVKEVLHYGEGTSYRCQWFAGKKLEDGIFSHESLVPVEKKSGEQQ